MINRKEFLQRISAFMAIAAVPSLPAIEFEPKTLAPPKPPMLLTEHVDVQRSTVGPELQTIMQYKEQFVEIFYNGTGRLEVSFDGQPWKPLDKFSDGMGGIRIPRPTLTEGPRFIQFRATLDGQQVVNSLNTV